MSSKNVRREILWFLSDVRKYANGEMGNWVLARFRTKEEEKLVVFFMVSSDRCISRSMGYLSLRQLWGEIWGHWIAVSAICGFSRENWEGDNFEEKNGGKSSFLFLKLSRVEKMRISSCIHTLSYQYTKTLLDFGRYVEENTHLKEQKENHIYITKD